MNLKPCVFLDRDGVLNEERGEYTFRLEDFRIKPGVKESLLSLKKAGYLLVVITNQAGIAKGIYTENDVMACHNYLQKEIGYLIDDIYISPHHPTATTESLLRKPDSLMIEKAIAKHKIDPSQSWLIGDTERDIQAAHKAGVKGILISKDKLTEFTFYHASSIAEAVEEFIVR
jgi:D-glycero-D-manno-heptose 1,7-bisphosphate phosphatase